MSKISTIKENILKYLELKGITKYRFYQDTGISNGVLDKNTGLSEDNIEKIISYYIDINPLWLITGKGDMLIKEHDELDVAVKEPEIKYELQCKHCDEKERIITAKDKIIETQDITIQSLKEIITELRLKVNN